MASVFDAVARRVEPGARLLRAWPLTGGVSAQATGLEIALPDGTTRKLVVRRHGPADLVRGRALARQWDGGAGTRHCSPVQGGGRMPMSIVDREAPDAYNWGHEDALRRHGRSYRGGLAGHDPSTINYKL